MVYACADPESFVRGVQLKFFISGPPTARQRNAGHQRPASETPFRWRAVGGPLIKNLSWTPLTKPTLNAGL